MKNSVAAASRASATSAPGRKPADSMARLIRSNAAVVPATSGAKPPSSPRPVDSPSFFRTDLSAWYTSAPQRNASTKLGAPIGATMNS
ncbi:Uncharacterised protein [Mycobacterium tuberculosis]|nr:Uncharacterised protein [Mycobacterium tuberculosis]COW97211.1 Uncharacterised protein [Mycobacterium tuberculosis]